VRLGVLLRREVAVHLLIGAEVAAHRRGQDTLLVAAHGGCRDQLVEGGVARRQFQSSGCLELGRAGAPMPEPRRFALDLDLVGLAQARLLDGRLGDLARVERGVVRGQFGELQRPEEGAECLAAPDGVDDYRVAVRLGHALERGLELRAQGAAAFDDLSLGAKPAARHRFASLA